MKYFNSCNVVLDQRNTENKSFANTSTVLPFFQLILASMRNECRPRNLMRNTVNFPYTLYHTCAYVTFR